MGSIIAWKTRVNTQLEFAGQMVDVTFEVKRASVADREEIQELVNDSVKVDREFKALVEQVDNLDESAIGELNEQTTRLLPRMRKQVEQYVIGVEGVSFDNEDGTKSEPTTGANLLAVFDDPSFVREVWNMMCYQQFLRPKLGEASAATQSS